VLGTLLQVNAAGGWRVVADIAAYEAAVDPNGGLIKMIVDLAFDDDARCTCCSSRRGRCFSPARESSFV